jgi:hypothetical protein
MTTKLSDLTNYRQLVALRYLNASEEIWRGLKTQQGKNDFHFLVTLRSFIEYTRRGIWFLAWATDSQLEKAEHLTFNRSGSPGIVKMDEKLSEALGLGKVSGLVTIIPKVNEPYIDCLHALTHGNPISVKMVGIGLGKIFDTAKLLIRTEADLNLFRILVYRRLDGEEFKPIWDTLSSTHNRPDDLKANVKVASQKLKKKHIPITG